MFCLKCCPKKNVEGEDGEQSDQFTEENGSQSFEIDQQPQDYYNVHRNTVSNDPEQENEFYMEVTTNAGARGPVECESEYAEPSELFGCNNLGPPTKPKISANPQLEKKLMAKFAQTIGADGTLYTDLGHSFRTLSCKANAAKCQSSFSKSEYASIDHNVKPLPAPPKIKSQTSKREKIQSAEYED